MKKLSTYLFLILFSFSVPSFAGDISKVEDIEIEGISIGDSLLKHLSKEEIIKEIEINKHAYNYLNDDFGEVYLFSNFDNYHHLSFLVKQKNDKNYIIYFIKGSISYDNKLEECFAKREEIKKEFSNKYKNAKKKEHTLEFDWDPTGESVTHNITFYFDSGGYSEINCTKYKQSLKNEYGWKDSLQVVIGSEEVLDWFDNPIN